MTIENQQILTNIIGLIESCVKENIELAWQVGIGAETYIPNFNIKKFLLDRYDFLQISRNKEHDDFVQAIVIHLSAKKLSFTNAIRLPNWLGILKNLEHLIITHSYFTEIPKTITSLENLKNLEIIHSKLEDLTKDIGKMKNLKALNLTGSRVGKFPREMENLQNLNEIFLDGNPISLESYYDLQDMLPNCTIYLPSQCG
jgi:Leucine-rich repeat (LRR) protein